MAGFANNLLIGGAVSFTKDAQFRVGLAGGASDPAAPTSQPAFTPGQMVSAYDPYWGWAELVYAQFQTASTAVNVGDLVQVDRTGLLSLVPNTANTGASVGVVVTKFPASALVSATNPLFGWVMISGTWPIATSAASVAGPLYIGAAGKVTSTAAAGKQLANARAVVAGTGTVTKTVYTTANSNLITVAGNDYSGVFVGQAVSGTGIAGGSTVASLDTGKNSDILLSAAATATGTITATFTNTGFVVAQISRASVQTQIT